VDLVVIAPAERHMVAVADPLPAGFEAVDYSLRGESASEQLRLGPEPSGYDRREIRDDRVVFFVDRMEAGVHRFVYAARPVIPGDYYWPPARAEEMYAPEVFATTAPAQISVR
jgi:uncharacterized protein YfaS (alpha-2-macroglobulin family)